MNDCKWGEMVKNVKKDCAVGCLSCKEYGDGFVWSAEWGRGCRKLYMIVWFRSS